MQNPVQTARATGLAYLTLALGGIISFFVVRNGIVVPDDAMATLTNLTEQTGRARLGLAGDITLIIGQALAAVGFYKLFSTHDRAAAWALGAFGMANAAILMVATVFSIGALAVVENPGLAPGDQAASVQMLYQLNASAWEVGAIFFGLWLIPMGYVVWRYAVMPRALGMVLMVGGVGYVASAYLYRLLPDAGTLIEVSTIPATVGEFWMIGYLLAVGVRRVDRAAVAIA